MNLRHTVPYLPFKNFLIRTPLFPISRFADLNKEYLLELFDNPIIKEAIFLASPVLFDECKKLCNNLISVEKEKKRIIYSLSKYLLRMSTRCTPFGLFAGCAVGQWIDGSEIRSNKELILSMQKYYRRHTRLDMHYLCSLAQDLTENTTIKEELLFYPNSSIYKYGTKIRYVEYRYINKRRIHHLISVDNSEYLEKILIASKNGNKISSLIDIIVNDEISYFDALDFINELISNQLLVSELEPAITGEEFLDQILNILSRINGADEIIDVIQKTKKDIENIDSEILGVDVSKYYLIAENLNKLKTEFEVSLLFQTDLIKPTVKSNLDKSYADDILKAIFVMSVFTPKSLKSNLAKFCEIFLERYESKEVPLMEVLDSETGIGYGQNMNSVGDISPLIDDFRTPQQGNEFREISWNSIQSFLLKKFLEAYRSQLYEVEITDNEIAQFKNDFSDLPDTISVMVQLFRDNIYVSSMGGSSAANLLGRFCHSDGLIYKMTKEITDKETELNPEIIFAEIVHLPESRTGNVLLRPVLRKYEIPFLAKANVNIENQIPLNDLMISVNGNKIFLRSVRLNKQIVPRLSTAHNYSNNSLPIYHFLCDLQLQDSRWGLGFSWGELQNEFNFLPRVLYQNIILSLAQWNLKKEEYEQLFECNNKNLSDITINWRKKLKIPRYIALAEGDNELVIDLENSLCVETFIDAIKKRQSIKLLEFLFDPATAVVKSEEGSFANQFIIPFYKTKEYETLKLDNKSTQIENVPLLGGLTKRTFVTGNEWLYYKFYMGTKTSDHFLSEIILPLASELISEGIIDKWFFIRYSDPNHHIRLRFHGVKDKFYSEIIERLNQLSSGFVAMGLTWKIQTDTYNRELERYGFDTIEFAESLFYYDSIMIVNMLNLIEGDEGEKFRWLFGLRAIDTFLDDFKLNISQKKELMQTFSEGFYAEFNMNKEAKAHLGQKYRKEKLLVENVMNKSKDDSNEMKPLLELISERSIVTKEIIDNINNIHLNNRLTVPFNSLLNSYLHMFCNRLFRSKQRVHEMVLYTFLMKYYESQIAREKSKHNEIVMESDKILNRKSEIVNQ